MPGRIAKSGVRHAVALSSIGGERPSGTGPIAGLHAQEERLKRLTGANVLVLRPGFFFENFLHSLDLIRHQGINGGGAAGRTTLPMIATQDIAAFAARALAARDWSGFQVRELLGQRDLSFDEATRIIGAKIGKPDLAYVQFPYADYSAALQQAGVSKSVADAYAEMEKAFDDGIVKSIEGRNAANTTPTAFEQFADVIAQAYHGTARAGARRLTRQAFYAAAMLQNRSMPASTVIPVLAYPSVPEAVAWLSAAFGFTLRLGIGDHRAQLNAGDGAIVITGGGAAADAARVDSIMVRVDDARAHCDRAAAHGATIAMPPTDFPYGERQYTAHRLQRPRLDVFRDDRGRRSARVGRRPALTAAADPPHILPAWPMRARPRQRLRPACSRR